MTAKRWADAGDRDCFGLRKTWIEILAYELDGQLQTIYLTHLSLMCSFAKWEF